MRVKGSVTGQFLSGARRSRSRRGARRTAATSRSAARREQPEADRRRVPGREVRRRRRRLRLRQVDPRQRDRLQGAANRLNRMRVQAGRAPRSRGSSLRQGDRHRPEADRPDAALEPGHLHRPVHAHPRLYSLTPEAKVRATSRALLLQRPRGPLRDVQGRRDDQIEMRFLPDVYVPCETCQGHRYNRRRSRFASRASRSRTCSRCRSRRRSASSPRSRSCGGAATLHDVGLDYIKLGQPATTLSGGEAQRVKLAAELSRSRPGDALHPRRADDGPPLRRHREAARGAAAARRRRQHGARDRAQPRRDQAGRLGRSISGPRAARRGAS